MAAAEPELMLEGFLCPLCKQDCRSVQELEAHYRQAHDESAASKKFKKEFISFFENAFKISPKQTRAERSQSPLRSSEEGVAVLEPVTNVSGIATEYWPPQEMGCVQEHTIQFRRARDVCLAGATVATNRVVIRLEKLFRSIKDSTPRTAKEKKSVEQNIVPWKKDKEEKQCGGCGGRFGLRRRRHHCRLCGDIRCKECCQFMTLLETYPVLHDCPDYTSLVPPPSKKKLKFKISRPDQSCPDDDEDADEIRMCRSCKNLLDRRLSRLVPLVGQHKIVALYEKMTATMAESEDKKPGFVEIAKCLVVTPGEVNTDHHCKRRHFNANNSCVCCLKWVSRTHCYVHLTHNLTSKRILSMGAADPSPRGQKLARGIRGYVSNYLQEHLLTVSSLPTQQQLMDIKERQEREARERLEEIERQREEQRILNAKREAQAAAEEKSAKKKISVEFKIKDKESHSITFGSEKAEAAREKEKGWMCETHEVVTFDNEDDPFVMQRDQLLSFIAQARQAKRLDEVRALEESLMEIEAVMEGQKSYGFQ